MKKLFFLTLFWLTSYSLFAQNPIRDAKNAVSATKEIRLNMLPNGTISGIFEKVIGLVEGRIPSMTKAQFLAGQADTTALVVLLKEPLNSQYYVYSYTGDTTASTSDKDGQFDGYRKIVAGKRSYEIQERVVTPGQFGAKGDGIANDFPAWQRTIAYAKAQSKAPAIIADAAAYEFAGGNLIIDKAKISIFSNGSAIENGQFSVSSPTWGQEYSATVQGLNFKYDTFIKNNGTDRSGRFGVYIKNVTRVKVLDNTFENMNAGVYFEPTGYKQAIKTIKIVGNKFGKSNYGIWIPKVTDSTYATVPAGNNKATRLVGDITVTDNEFRGPELDAVNMYGIDGIQFHNNLIFMPNYLNSAGFASKRYNFACEGCTYMNMTGGQYFEAGLDAVLLVNCDLVIFANNHIALPGQTWSGSAIHIKRTSDVSDATKYFESFNFNNITIDGSTEKAVFLEGNDFPSTGYRFTNIHLRRFLQSGVYYGDDGDITPPRPLPTNVPKYSLYAEKAYNNVIWDAEVDQYNSDRHYVSLGQGGRFHEGNAYNNTEVTGTSINPTGITDFTGKDDKESILENKFIRSSTGFNDPAIWTKNNITAKDTTFAIGARGTIDAPGGKLTATSTSGTHYISTVGSMAVPKVVGDSSAWTFSGYFKAPANSTRPVVSITLAGGFTSSKGAQIVFDAKSGVIGYAKGTTFGGYTSDGMYVRNPIITKGEDGWWKVVISWLPASGSATTNVRIHMAEKMSPVGSFTYAGDANSVVYLADLQLSNTNKELPHSPTTGTAKARTPISFSGGVSNPIISITDPKNEITTSNDGLGNVTIGFNKVSTTAGHIENLVKGSRLLSSGVSYSNNGNLTITAVPDTTNPFGRGTIYRIKENTDNSQKAFWNNSTITKPAIQQNYTGSIIAKAEGITAVSIMFSAHSGTGSIIYDVDLTTGKVIGNPIVNAGTYSFTNYGYTLERFTNGYFRISPTVTVSANAPSVRMWVYLKGSSGTAGNAAYLGTGRSFLMTGYQISQSDFPLDNTPTEAGLTQALRPIYHNGIWKIVAGTGTNVLVDSAGVATLGIDQKVSTTSVVKFGRVDIALIDGTAGAGDISSATAAQKKFHFTTNDIRTISYGVASNEHFQIDYFDATGTVRTRAFNISNTSGNATIDKELTLGLVPVYADNAAATTAGLAVGKVYRTATGVLMIRY